jgi:hypothetical protein
VANHPTPSLTPAPDRVPHRPALPVEVRLDPHAAPGDLVSALATLLLDRARRAESGEQEGGAGQAVDGVSPDAKEERQYQGTVIRLVGEMRLDGTLPWEWIADITRRIRQPLTYSSPSEALIALSERYKRSIWDAQDCLVIILCEKDAMLGVLEQETRPYQVPLVITRGFPSLSLLHDLAELIEGLDKPVYIYYFGDLDPSGVWIDRSVEERLNELAPAADLTFERIAVLPEQIEELGLPTRPTKNHPKNTHARDFDGDSVELDAIPAATLRAMVRECIVQHIDQAALDEIREAEEADQEKLFQIAKRLSKKK